MPRIAFATAVACLLAGCTWGSISSLPIQTARGDLYRYEGRANFPHQIAEADKMITDHCAHVNGGRPVIVNQQKQYLGDVAFGNASATTTGSTVVSGNVASGVATTPGGTLSYHSSLWRNGRSPRHRLHLASGSTTAKRYRRCREQCSAAHLSRRRCRQLLACACRSRQPGKAPLVPAGCARYTLRAE